MTKLVNRAKMTTATTGTGTLTLGSAVDGYQTFADAGVANADVVRYVIEDGDAWEIGLGTYTASGTTLTRGSIESSNSDNPLNLTGNAVVFVSAAAADLQELVDFADNFVLPTADGSTGQVLTTNGAGTLSFTTISGYTNSDVDAHLNTSTASAGEVLSWTGTDYDWIAAPAVLLGDTDSASPFETSLGFEAGLNTTGVNNTFVGYQAGKANSTAANNTAIGFRALDVNTTSPENTAVGMDAMGSLTGGAGSNTAVGVSSLRSLTTGNFNTALGVDALLNATTGYNLVGLGDAAGRRSQTSFASTYVGSSAGRNSNGAFNIGIGFYGLAGSNTSPFLTGEYNVGIGVETANSMTTASHNFLGGYRAGYVLTTGSNNVAIGNGALDAATTGGRNIAIGQDAMGLGVATAASGNNVGIGVTALNAITSGTNNVGVGNGAGSTLTTGANNTLLGNGAAASSATVSNEITLGNSSITTLRCQVTTITSLSDARDKTDIQPLKAGLEFVEALNPVSFTWNMRDGGKIGEADTGFIAQDLQAAQAETGVTIPGLVFDANPDKLEAGYGKLIPILVQAIKDLSAKVNELEARLEDK